MPTDAEIMAMVRAYVSGGRPIDDALGILSLPRAQRVRIKSLAEQELGLEVTVGPGIGQDVSPDWLNDREIDWFHWERLKSLLAREGKLSAGAIRTLGNVSRTLLERLPPPDHGSDFRWMGMVVGNVQSGKTGTFTALISKAADAGYQLFIVLSGLLNTLRLQTQLRLSKEVLGKKVLGGIEMPAGRKWHPLTQDQLEGDWGTPGGMGVDLLQRGQTPSLAVIKKNVTVMARFNDWLEHIQLTNPTLIAELPVMIIDDESDEASIDTSSGADPSSTNRELRRLLGVFKKRSYIGFTATPYANCFIPDDANHRDWGEDLYPSDFILPLRTSESYTGSDRVFGCDPVWEPPPKDPLPGLYQEIPEEELKELVPPKGKHASFKPRGTPSFRKALLGFYLAGAARAFRGEKDKPCTMLIHLSKYRAQHAAQRKLIARLHDEIFDALLLGNGRDTLLAEFKELWESDYRPTTRSLNASQDVGFGKVRQHLKSFVESVQIRVVNQDSDDLVDFVREPKLKAIVIGGQNLGRGLSFEGLVTTVFLRPPGNQSTAMQMQRWCGYRKTYLDLVRVYTADSIRTYYREFLAIEQEMRDELFKYERDGLSPKEVGMKLRQHPDVPLVSAAKRGAMRPVTGQYGGTIPQTTVFPMDDDGLLQNNVDALGGLVRMANAEVGGQPKHIDGKYVWEGITPGAVMGFLAAYEHPSHSGRTSFRCDAIRRYVKGSVDGGALTKWTIAICSLKTKVNGRLEGLPLKGYVNRVVRVPVTGSPERLGIITDPEHEAIGLETDARGREARAQRSPENGLLLIYPIAHPKREKKTIIGVAFSFSGQLKDRGVHVAGSVALEDEQAAD